MVWGVTFVLVKGALAEISPLLFNAVRMALAALSLLLIFHRELRRMEPAALRVGATAGILLWIGYEFQTTGLKLTTASKSAFLTGVSVVLVPVFQAIGWRRMTNRWTTAGVCAAFAGLYLLAVPAARGSGLDLGGINRGDLLTLGCAVAFALQVIAMGWATTKYPFQQIAAVEVTICAGLMLGTTPLLETTYAVWSSQVIWSILITSLLATGLAFTIQAWAQQFTPPAHTALIFALEPVFASIMSYLVLNERLGMRATLGAMLILSGVLTSDASSS